ncbi:MAG: SH3 domain-containing protein, partial [Anaerolineae bacterium]|nr:SH3 domain-containing protein [Anaerolineae bacterium]
PTATLPSPCLALTKFNINLRSKPDSNAAVDATIPFDNTISLYGRSEDSVWWYGEFEGKQGWLRPNFCHSRIRVTRCP